MYRTRAKGERSPLARLIETAVKIASDYLVPDGLDRQAWRKLTPEERLYLKGVEVEAHGEAREGVYQEFARGFGAADYRALLASGAANQVRVKTPSELAGHDLQGQGFAGSLLRQLLYAIYATARRDDHDPRPARDYLKRELVSYWDSRQHLIKLLTYLSQKPKPEGAMPHWKPDVEAAALLLGSLQQDSA